MKFSSREGLFAYAKGLGDHLNLISVPRDNLFPPSGSPLFLGCKGLKASLQSKGH